MGIREKQGLAGSYCPKFNSPSCVPLPSDVQRVNMQKKAREVVQETQHPSDARSLNKSEDFLI